METKFLHHCPNCEATIKSGPIGTAELFNDQAIKLINEYTDIPKAGYCTNCGEHLYNNAMISYTRDIASAAEKLIKVIANIPVITLPAPLNWDYSVVKMVTAHSTVETNLYAGIAAALKSLMPHTLPVIGSILSPKPLPTYSDHVKSSEEDCMTQLRVQALQNHANAVIDVDIDYFETGGSNNITRVCMAGTAIQLKNTDILYPKFKEEVTTITENYKRLSYLKSLGEDK